MARALARLRQASDTFIDLGLVNGQGQMTRYTGPVKSGPNVSNTPDPEKVQWRHWIEAGRPGVGIGEEPLVVPLDGVVHHLHQLLAAGMWVDQRGSNILDGAAPFYDTYETGDGRFVRVRDSGANVYGADSGGFDLDAIAVTRRPGLIGSLLVGVSVAKSLAFTRGLPLVGVHHIEGHLLANAITLSAFAGEAVKMPLARGRYNRLFKFACEHGKGRKIQDTITAWRRSQRRG